MRPRATSTSRKCPNRNCRSACRVCPTIQRSAGCRPLSDNWVEPIPAPSSEMGLSGLFDRLVDDSSLYAPLNEADDVFAGPAAALPAEPLVPPVEPEPAVEAAEPDPERDMIATVIEYADDPEIEQMLVNPPATEPAAPDSKASHWLITGRGFRPLSKSPPSSIGNHVELESPMAPPPAAEPVAEPSPEPESPMAPIDALASVAVPADPEAAERVSRYNFEELDGS